MLSAIRDDRGRSLPAVRSIELVVRHINVFLFNFVRVFYEESLGRKSFRFLHVSIKILSSELNVFPYFFFRCIIITHEVTQ